MRASHLVAAIGSSVLLVVALAAVAYLFRGETVNNPELGVISYHFRWGKLVGVTADTNRDGATDVRAQLDDSGIPKEYWEDSNHDGSFDRHVVMHGTVIQQVDLDKDADGKYEQHLMGTAARRFYRPDQRIESLSQELRQHTTY